MKSKLLVSIMLFCCLVSNAQNISLTFSGTGAASQIDSLTATNLATGKSVSLPGNVTLFLTDKSGIPTIPGLSGQGVFYPNPFSGTATYSLFASNPQTVFLTVQNLFGQIVARTTAFILAGENEFSLSLNAAGIYLVSMTTQQGTVAYKVFCSETTGQSNAIQYLGSGAGGCNNFASSGLKSSMKTYMLAYTIGDLIYYKCKSGIYQSVFTDSPVSSKNYEVEFVNCTDQGGKSYAVTKIGTQTWMAENLAYLPAISSSAGGSDTSPFYYVYGYEGNKVNEAKAVANYITYGVLYNWEAAKIACPKDWKLPNEDEWSTLAQYLGSSVGGKMKETGTTHWVSPNEGATNESGFTGIPAGLRSYPGGFADLGSYAYWWSAAGGDATHAWVRIVANYDDGFGRYSVSRNRGYSVRCLAGNAAVAPKVATAEITEIGETSATGGGTVSSDGGAAVTARGVCWNTLGLPTIADKITTGGSGTGIFVSSLTGLTAGTRYFVRAYATNSAGTSYGDEINFTTQGGGNGSFIDSRDGHVYKFLAYGSQIWMTENLAYLPSVSPSNEGSETSPYYYVYGYEGASVTEAKATSNYTVYGALYNFEASKIACPPGWRLPSDNEWTDLTNFVGSTPGNKMKEAGTSHWETPNAGATNESGFNVLPGGYRIGSGGFGYIGKDATFRTSTPSEPAKAWSRALQYTYDGVWRDSRIMTHGFSVRCLKE